VSIFAGFLPVMLFQHYLPSRPTSAEPNPHTDSAATLFVASIRIVISLLRRSLTTE
jgi:hypothetical protein